jgi:hypothetical protein
MKIGFSEQLHRKIIFSGGWVKDSPVQSGRRFPVKPGMTEVVKPGMTEEGGPGMMAPSLCW